MSRYRTGQDGAGYAGSQDDGALEDGDDGFLGVNQLTQAGQLSAGEVADAKNGRFTAGKSEPRLGVAKLPWTNRVTSSSTTPQPFGQVWGAGEFRDANGLEWVVIAADGHVFRTRENAGATELSLPPGTTIDAAVTFTQTVNGLVMFRGPDLPELIMPTLDVGFTPMGFTANSITGAGTENPADGTDFIPNARSGEWINNRLFIPFKTSSAKDLLAVSDYLNATRYLAQRSQGRINQGSSDELIRFFKFNDNAGIAFKGASVYVLSGLTGDLTDMSLDELTKAYGLAGAKAVAQVGKDVWYLAPKVGVASVTLTDAGKLQGVDVPVSAEVQELIKRIDWRYASGATFAYWNNRLFCAVPLDDGAGVGPELVATGSVYPFTGIGVSSFGVQGVAGAWYRWVKGANDTSIDVGDGPNVESGDFLASSEQLIVHGTELTAVTVSLKRIWPGVNNAILVYDFLRQKWAGYDQGAAIMVKEWFQTTYAGVRRLFFLSADGFVNLMEELYFDEVATEVSGAAIAPTALTLAYQTYTVVEGEVYSFTVRNGVTTLPTGTVVIENGDTTITPAFGTGPGYSAAGWFVARTTTVAVVTLPAAIGKTFHLCKVSYGIGTEFIDHDVLYRGYRCGTNGRKRFRTVSLELEWWYPQFSVSAVTEGMNEETAVRSDVTKDVTRYDKPAHRVGWDRTNVNDDHGDVYRQDYSIVLGETTTPSGSIVAGLLYFVEDLTGAASITYNAVVVNAPGTFVGVAGVTTYAVGAGVPKVYGPGNYVFMGENGLQPDQHQEEAVTYRLPAVVRGRQVQVRVRNNQGRCTVLAMGVEGARVDRRDGSFV